MQATRTIKKWTEAIKEGFLRIGRIVKGAYQVVESKKYRERYKEVSGIDPMICRYCGEEMGLWKIWHPKYGVIYDEWENIKAGKYEQKKSLEEEGGNRYSVRASTEGIQLLLFPV